MAQSSLDRQLDQVLDQVIFFAGRFLKSVWQGIKRLNKGKNILGFLISLGAMVIAWRTRNGIRGMLFILGMPGWLQRLIYILLLMAPILYLYFLGNAAARKQIEYFRKFAEIGFKEKSGKYPLYLSEKQDEEGRTLFTFRSNISIGEWKRKSAQLETVFDCTILKIENTGSKRIIELLTVSSEFEISKSLLWKDEYLSGEDGVIVVGQGMISQISFNLNRTPHVLAAGETGSGKSVVLRCCLWQMLKQNARVYMIDFKGGVEFGLDYERFGEVITERNRALEVLEMLVRENEQRLTLFRKLRVKNLLEYNQKTGENLCRIGVFCDEVAEMLDQCGVKGKEKEVYSEIEANVATLARLSRATGINLFLGVQRPDAKVLPGQIKNNVPIRICGHFVDKSASEIVLNTTAATNLPDIKGRFLFRQGNELLEFQAYYFDDETMLDLSLELEPGKMMIEDSSPPPYKAAPAPKSGSPQVEVKQVNYEDFDFDFGEEIEWSVDK